MPTTTARILTVAAALLLAAAAPASAQITLGTAENFGVLGGSAVTNTGPSVVTGEVGVSPGSSVTGFPPGVVVGGTIHAADAVAAQAQTDLTAAYDAILATPCTVNLTGQDLGGLTLTPGVYCFDTSAALTGTLTLDFQGNPNALFLFKIGSTLVTASGSSVVIVNGAGGETCPRNVFFQVGSSATLGTGSTFRGNILALTSITLTTGANLFGRSLARNGAVTLDTNNVTRCGAAAACTAITVNPATLPNGTVGTAYSQTITATGGTAPYTFSISSGSLPPGLTLNPATGSITGSPTTPGTFEFSVTATDSAGCIGTRAYTLIIAAPACPAIALNPAALPSGRPGVPYNQTITASGGTAPYTYSIASGALPAGLTLNPATGTISGTPVAPGTSQFTVRATDASGCPGTRAYTLVILAATCPAITINPATLPPGDTGMTYNQTLTATGGTAPYTFMVTSGALPTGVTLNPATGVISGLPTTPGVFNFTIGATDANGCPATARALSITISLAVPTSVPALGTGGLALLGLLLAAAGLVLVPRFARQTARRP